jgi:hypothetical protein
MRLPVFVVGWQLECCMEPPSVGDQVEWQLIFAETPPDAPERDGKKTVELDVVAHPFDDPPVGRSDDRGVDHFDIRLEIAGTDGWLFWSAPRLVAGPARLTGTITEDHHVDAPDTLPPTVGTVGRIEVESQRYRLGAEAWSPVPGTETYEPVTTSPKWFGRSSEHEDHTTSHQTGILVGLELANLAARL